MQESDEAPDNTDHIKYRQQFPVDCRFIVIGLRRDGTAFTIIQHTLRLQAPQPLLDTRTRNRLILIIQMEPRSAHKVCYCFQLWLQQQSLIDFIRAVAVT